MSSVESSGQWRHNLPLAVLNYKKSNHSNIYCELSEVFHGRIPCDVLDHKLGFQSQQAIPAYDGIRSRITT